MNTKPTVLVTVKLPDAVEARLQRDFDVRLHPDTQARAKDAVATDCAGADALVCSPTDKIDADVINALPDSIKIIATFSVGYDHVDVNAAKARGIPVANTPDVLTDATADIAMLCLLGATRRAYEAQSMLRAGEWKGWHPTQLMGIGLAGKRCGILGMGRIGRAFRDRVSAFGVTVHYHARTRLAPDDEKGAVYHDTAESLLAVSDVLSIHCPLTPETKHFINAERIELMPEGAVIVNTARGPVVDDDALMAALKSGRLMAAGLDVFEGEPNVNPGYLDIQNAYLLPHLGSATVETRNAMGFRVCDNLDAFFAGNDIPFRVV